jgi:hypothetical protein
MSLKFLPLLDFEKTFLESPSAKVIPCGVESFTSKKQVDDFMRYIVSDGNIGLSMTASCQCHHTEGMYQLGMTCPLCKTEVVMPMAAELDYSSWLELPEFIPPMLQPAAYRIISTWMKTFQRKKLLDEFLKTDGELPEQIAARFKPGLWNFYNNFDAIISFLANEYPPLKLSKSSKNGKVVKVNQQTEMFLKFVELYRKCIFTRHYPVLNRSMHVVNKQGTLSLTDQASEMIIKATYELANVHYCHHGSKNMDDIEACALEMLMSYLKYSDQIEATKLEKKQGLIRHNILGARCHFTFRAVIVPITDASYGDELHLPWGVGVQQHKLEILNLLVNRKLYSPHEAQALYEKSRHSYDPIVNDILKTLIDESPHKGLPCLLGRNPSLFSIMGPTMVTL